MMLYVNGQDISRIVLGWIDQGAWVAQPEVFSVAPEAFLATVDRFTQGRAFAGVVVVTGPGSATALRASLSMVNALAFALRVPVYPVEKAPEEMDDTVLPLLADVHAVPMAVPVYTSGARITASTKDALKRRIDV